MNFFTPPKSNYTTYYKQGAFDLTWRYNAFMVLLYTGLMLAGSLISFNGFLIGLACWTTPALSRVIMKRTLKFELVAYMQVIMGAIITGIVLHVNLVHVHIVEVIFMLIVCFYAFITLGRKVGIIVLVSQFIWFTVYILRNPRIAKKVSFEDDIALVVALLVAMSLFGFLITEFLKLRKTAENNYVTINKDLNEINHLVNVQYQEKTVMLKEIHHRVKNNLQVISSLLRLQSYEIEEESSKMHFGDAINRVSAMALIHEKMYQNENLSQINLENYIESLAGDLVQTHAQDLVVKLKVITDIQELGNDTLVPVALILNELITNSLKHAFEGKSEGLIEIELMKSKSQNYFNFIYKDGGEWKSSAKGSSFGLELIATLTEQLDGKVERTYENGTKYEFSLKDLK